MDGVRAVHAQSVDLFLRRSGRRCASGVDALQNESTLMSASQCHYSVGDVKEPVPSTNSERRTVDGGPRGRNRTEMRTGQKGTETVAAEIQPVKSTFTAPEVLLYTFLVSAVGVGAVLDGFAWMSGVGGLLIVGGLLAFRTAYVTTHRKVETTACLADGHLVVRDPNPWWQQFTLTEGRRLHLAVDALEEQDGTRVVLARTTGSLGLRQQYRVWLEGEAETGERGPSMGRESLLAKK